MNKDLITNIITSKETKDNYQEFLKLKEQVNNGLIIDIEYLLTFMNYDKDYIKLRAFILIVLLANTNQELISKELSAILNLLNSNKPTIVRQTISYLPLLIKSNELLKPIIIEYINKIDINQYADSMAPLIEKDILEFKKIIS